MNTSRRHAGRRRTIGFYRDSRGRTRPITPRIPFTGSPHVPVAVDIVEDQLIEKNGERVWVPGVDTKNKYPSLEQVKRYLENNVSLYGVQRLEGNLSVDDFRWHKFNTLREADDYLETLSRTAPETDKGYHKARVDIVFKDHSQRELRVDLNVGKQSRIEDQIYHSDKFYAEHPDLAQRFLYTPYIKFGKSDGRPQHLYRNGAKYRERKKFENEYGRKKGDYVYGAVVGKVRRERLAKGRQ